MNMIRPFGEAPEAWDNPENGSALENLLILGGIPLLVIAVITLLVYLPSMIRRQAGEPALAFRDRSEWFGGPRRGVSAAEQVPVASEGGDSGKGGSGARW